MIEKGQQKKKKIIKKNSEKGKGFTRNKWKIKMRIKMKMENKNENKNLFCH